MVLRDSYSDDVPICERYDEGTADGSCLDTLVGDELREGCCRAEGVCGHYDEGWGCHRGQKAKWNFRQECGTPPPAGLPDPFVCTPRGEPCEQDEECCAHENYGAECSAFISGDDTPRCNYGPYE